MIMADSLEHMGVKPAEYKPQLPIFARLMINEFEMRRQLLSMSVPCLLTPCLMTLLFVILPQSYPSILGRGTENCEKGAEATASAAATEEEVEQGRIARFERSLIDWRSLHSEGLVWGVL
jgi:hypothetical protein